MLMYSLVLLIPVGLFLTLSIPIWHYLGTGENKICSSADAWLLGQGKVE